MAEFQISLAAARVNAGLTQEDVAREMQLSKTTVVSWEKGRSKPKPAEVKMMCEMYGIGEDYIFLPSI